VLLFVWVGQGGERERASSIKAVSRGVMLLATTQPQPAPQPTAARTCRGLGGATEDAGHAAHESGLAASCTIELGGSAGGAARVRGAGRATVAHSLLNEESRSPTLPLHCAA